MPNSSEIKHEAMEEEIVITVVDEEDLDDYSEYKEFMLDNKNILIEANPNIILEPVDHPTVILKAVKTEKEEIQASLEAILAKEGMKTTRRRRGSYNQRKTEAEVALCSVCGKLVRLRYISRHMSNHCNRKCDICSLVFKTEEELDKHNDIHRNNEHPCPNCEQSFKTAIEAAIHSNLHLGTFQCPICKFSTKSKSSICGHIKRHQGQYKHHCAICGKGFIGKALLATHEEIHLDIKQYTCDFCGKKFSVRRYLDVHRQLNHKKELYGIEELFDCDVCGRQFTFEKSLRRHKSVIHQIGEDRTVRCPICNKIIANNYNLKMHMRIHTGEKNYCCDKCGKAFSAYKYWKKHKMTHEKNKNKSMESRIEVIKVELEDDHSADELFEELMD